jgi:putative hemolysin
MVSLYSSEQFNMALSPSIYCIVNGSANIKEKQQAKWVSDYCLAPNEEYFSYIMARTSYIRLDYNDVGFVLDQHA